jgi:hypothetical protein
LISLGISPESVTAIVKNSENLDQINQKIQAENEKIKSHFFESTGNVISYDHAFQLARKFEIVETEDEFLDMVENDPKKLLNLLKEKADLQLKEIQDLKDGIRAEQYKKFYNLIKDEKWDVLGGLGTEIQVFTRSDDQWAITSKQKAIQHLLNYMDVDEIRKIGPEKFKELVEAKAALEAEGVDKALVQIKNPGERAALRGRVQEITAEAMASRMAYKNVEAKADEFERASATMSPENMAEVMALWQSVASETGRFNDEAGLAVLNMLEEQGMTEEFALAIRQIKEKTSQDSAPILYAALAAAGDRAGGIRENMSGAGKRLDFLGRDKFTPQKISTTIGSIYDSTGPFNMSTVSEVIERLEKTQATDEGDQERMLETILQAQGFEYEQRVRMLSSMLDQNVDMRTYADQLKVAGGLGDKAQKIIPKLARFIEKGSEREKRLLDLYSFLGIDSQALENNVGKAYEVEGNHTQEEVDDIRARQNAADKMLELEVKGYPNAPRDSAQRAEYEKAVQDYHETIKVSQDRIREKVKAAKGL